MHDELLPLFPLNVVLFPASFLPLHIFEERYKTLIRLCIRDDAEFGISLAHRQVMADVGCTARVVRVLHRYDDGRMDIVVEGRRRYRFLRYEAADRPYAVGRISLLAGTGDPVDQTLLRETRDLYHRLITVVYKGSVQDLPPEAGAADQSFVMAQKAGLDLQARQHLLEQDSENERLRILRSYFTEVLPKLSRRDEIERIIAGDGYLLKGGEEHPDGLAE